MTKYSPETVERVIVLWDQGVLKTEIEHDTGVTLSSITRLVCKAFDRGDPRASPRIRAPERQPRRQREAFLIRGRFSKVDSKGAPPEVIAERDMAVRRGHVSLTAALMGDPLPGRSAMERHA